MMIYPRKIMLRYVINGAKFRLTFAPAELVQAQFRKRVLEANGIPVKITGEAAAKRLIAHAARTVAATQGIKARALEKARGL